MYPGRHARERADQAAFIMASTGESVSYAEYEARANRLAHLLRADSR
jgi:long-chain acyl-CoA synthetase